MDPATETTTDRHQPKAKQMRWEGKKKTTRNFGVLVLLVLLGGETIQMRQCDDVVQHPADPADADRASIKYRKYLCNETTQA